MRARRTRRIVIGVVAVALLALVLAGTTGVLDEPDWLTCETAMTERPVDELVDTPPPVMLEATKVASVQAATGLVQDPVRGGWWASTKDGRIVQLDGDFAEVATPIVYEVGPGDEEGALSVAVSPDGSELLTSHTDLEGSVVVLAYPLDDSGVDVEVPREVFVLEQPRDTHNGGAILFDGDGYLWIGSGDGGGAMGKQSLLGRTFQGGEGHLAANGQDLSNLYGTLIRIDPTQTEDAGYRIPDDNPFVDDPDARDEIWSYGLRNPWQFSIDSATGDLWVGDVGGECWEEISLVAGTGTGPAGAGENFGWGHYEGQHLFEGGELEESTLPIAEFGHDTGYCAIVGGQVYRGEAIPELQGSYVFSDTCEKRIQALTAGDEGSWELADLGATVELPVGFAEDVDGELYVVSLTGIYALAAS